MTDIVKAKWTYPVLSEGFVPFPKRLIRCGDRVFSGSDGLRLLTLVMAIVDFAKPNQQVGPSVEYLSFTLDINENECRVRLTKLQERGLLNWRELESRLLLDLQPLFDRVMAETQDDPMPGTRKPEDPISPF